MSKENLKIINLVTESLDIWERYMKGRITRDEYQQLQEEKLKEIRRIQNNGKKSRIKK